MNSDTVTLTGLDGTNPLGFLAALGVLDVLHRRLGGGAPASWPRMHWENNGTWQPVVRGGVASGEAIIDEVSADLRCWDDSPALALAYTKNGERARPADKGAIRDLKPPPGLMHDYLGELAARAADGDRAPADLAAAFGTAEVLDNSGQVKPTALHFTAGQQRFLDMVGTLQRELSRDDLIEAVFGPWEGRSKLPSLSWDAAATRMYALRATDPSGEKRGSVPGAYWLGLLGLRFLPVVARRGRLTTTGVQGGWKTGRFTWPLWSVPATAPVVASLVGRDDLEQSSGTERRAAGVALVLRSAITRSDQGGYGAFSPPEVL